MAQYIMGWVGDWGRDGKSRGVMVGWGVSRWGGGVSVGSPSTPQMGSESEGSVKATAYPHGVASTAR